MKAFRNLNHHSFAGLSTSLRVGVLSKGYGFFLFALVMLMFVMPGAASAGMSLLSDNDMKGVTGQSGISIVMDGTANVNIGTYRFSDTEATPNWIELNNLIVDNGAGGGFSFSTPGADFSNPLVFDPNTIDLGTNSSGQTYVAIRDGSRVNPRTYTVGEFVFCNQSLGSVKLNALSEGPSVSHFGSNAGSGIAFDYKTAISASALTYNYNNALENLTLSGIHMAGSATGSPEDPYFNILPTNFLTYYATDPTKSLYTWPTNRAEILSDPQVLNGTIAGPSFTSLVKNFLTYYAADPTKSLYTWPANRAEILSDPQVLNGTIAGADPWVFSGTFNIGDIDSTPAAMDVGTVIATGTTSVFLSLPMAGSVHVEQVNFGSQNFGPIAIDGIQVHRLLVKIGGL